MKGLRIVNQTEWSTDDLRALIAACLKARGANGIRLVTFAYRREGTRRLGCAQYGGKSRMVKVGKRWVESTEGYRIRVNLPRPTLLGSGLLGSIHLGSTLMVPSKLAELLITIEHEVDHTMGLRHADMRHDAERDCLWAEDLLVRWTPKTAPSPARIRAEKLAKHAEAIVRLKRRAARIEAAIVSRTRRMKALMRAEKIAARRAP